MVLSNLNNCRIPLEREEKEGLEWREVSWDRDVSWADW